MHNTRNNVFTQYLVEKWRKQFDHGFLSSRFQSFFIEAFEQHRSLHNLKEISRTLSSKKG